MDINIAYSTGEFRGSEARWVKGDGGLYVSAGDHLGQCLRMAHISAAAFCLYLGNNA
jgi:hypothetical protein